MVYLAFMAGIITAFGISIWLVRRRDSQRDAEAIQRFNDQMSTLQHRVIEGDKRVR